MVDPEQLDTAEWLPGQWAEELLQISRGSVGEVEDHLRRFTALIATSPMDAGVEKWANATDHPGMLPARIWRAVTFWERELQTGAPPRAYVSFLDPLKDRPGQVLNRLLDFYRNARKTELRQATLADLHKYPGISMVLEKVGFGRTSDFTTAYSGVFYFPIDCSLLRNQVAPLGTHDQWCEQEDDWLTSLLRDSERTFVERLSQCPTVQEMVRVVTAGVPLLPPDGTPLTGKRQQQLGVVQQLADYAEADDRTAAADLLARLLNYAYWLDQVCSIVSSSANDSWTWEAIHYAPFAPRDIHHDVFEIGFSLNSAYRRKPPTSVLKDELTAFRLAMGPEYATYVVARLEELRHKLNDLYRVHWQGIAAHEFKSELRKVWKSLQADDRNSSITITEDLLMAVDALFQVGSTRIPFPSPGQMELALICAVQGCICSARLVPDLDVVFTFEAMVPGASELSEEEGHSLIIEYAIRMLTNALPEWAHGREAGMSDLKEDSAKLLAVMLRNLLLDAWQRCGDQWGPDGKRTTSHKLGLCINYQCNSPETFLIEIRSTAVVTDEMSKRSFKLIQDDYPVGYVTTISPFIRDLGIDELYDTQTNWLRGSQLAQKIAQVLSLELSLDVDPMGSVVRCQPRRKLDGPHSGLG